MRDNFAADFYGLPTYFITNHKTEICGHNVRIYHWEKRATFLTPLFVAVLSAADLASISQDASEVARRALIIPSGMRERQQAH